MFFYYYNLNKTLIMYKQSQRLINFSKTWSLFFLNIKFQSKFNNQLPKISKWSYRSYYTNLLHFKQKKHIKKAIYIHLFWILDILKLAHPLNIQGFLKNYPFYFQYNMTDSLAVYSNLYQWVTYYGVNKNKLFYHLVNKNWLNYNPLLWMSRSYNYFNTWRLKNILHRKYRRKHKSLWSLNVWYIDNAKYHKLQARLFCKVPEIYPTYFTKVLWLRLLQYPCVYNKFWYPMLKHLSFYTKINKLSWSILYTHKQTWMFNYKAKGLSNILKALVTHQKQITEYSLINCWRNLLKDKDLFSLSFQNFVKFLPAFLEHIDYVTNNNLNKF